MKEDDNDRQALEDGKRDYESDMKAAFLKGSQEEKLRLEKLIEERKGKTPVDKRIQNVYDNCIQNVYGGDEMGETSPLSVKKPEMIRRNKLVKWVRSRSEMYETMMRLKPESPEYMEGMADLLNKLCEDFDITPEEL